MGITLAINPGGIQHDDKLGFSHNTTGFTTKNVHVLVPWTEPVNIRLEAGIEPTTGGPTQQRPKAQKKLEDTMQRRIKVTTKRHAFYNSIDVFRSCRPCSEWTRRFMLGRKHSAAINSTWNRELWCLFRYLNWTHLAMFQSILFMGGITVFSDIRRPQLTVGYLQFRYDFSSHGYIDMINMNIYIYIFIYLFISDPCPLSS